MSIWNKILIGFIFIASVAFFYMSLRTLKTRQAWMSSYRGFKEAVEKENKLKGELLLGVEEDREITTQGIHQVRIELHKIMRARGRIWKGVEPAAGQVDAQTGEALVTVGSPNPHRIRERMIFQVFEEEPAGNQGRYLGEFKVVGVDEAENQVKLSPTFNLTRELDGKRLDQDRLDRLAASSGPWTLYERMPADNHEIFAELSEEELAELVPADLLAKYAKHGKPADPDDPEDRVDAEGNYDRELLDFELLMRIADIDRSKLIDLTKAERRDRDSVNVTLADAKLQVEFQKKTIQQWTEDLRAFSRERDAALAHLDEVTRCLADTQKQIGSAIVAIQSKAAEIAQIQRTATERINARTRALMQAGAGQ